MKNTFKWTIVNKNENVLSIYGLGSVRVKPSDCGCTKKCDCYTWMVTFDFISSENWSIHRGKIEAVKSEVEKSILSMLITGFKKYQTIKEALR